MLLQLESTSKNSLALSLAGLFLNFVLVGAAIAQTDREIPPKPPQKATMVVKGAAPESGIFGHVFSELFDKRIDFESRVLNGVLTARVAAEHGRVLFEYTEVKTPIPWSPDTFEWVPSLRIDGKDYVALTPEQIPALRAIAESPEGSLLRHLGLYLVYQAPSADLTSERRGLEIPYQALQSMYATLGIQEFSPDMAVLPKPGEVGALSYSEDPSQSQWMRVPENCVQSKCKYISTPDYQLSAVGGFVNKNVSPLIVFSHNFHMRPPDEQSAKAKTHTDSAKQKPAAGGEDGGQVDDCFGACGGGCSGCYWTHEWIQVDNFENASYTCAGGNSANCAPDDHCCGNNLQRTATMNGLANNIAHCKVTPGAIAHDILCRGPNGALDPLCIAGIEIGADCALALITPWPETTFSYVGPYSGGTIDDLGPSKECCTTRDCALWCEPSGSCTGDSNICPPGSTPFCNTDGGPWQCAGLCPQPAPVCAGGSTPACLPSGAWGSCPVQANCPQPAPVCWNGSAPACAQIYPGEGTWQACPPAPPEWGCPNPAPTCYNGRPVCNLDHTWECASIPPVCQLPAPVCYDGSSPACLENGAWNACPPPPPPPPTGCQQPAPVCYDGSSPACTDGSNWDACPPPPPPPPTGCPEPAPVCYDGSSPGCTDGINWDACPPPPPPPPTGCQDPAPVCDDGSSPGCTDGNWDACPAPPPPPPPPDGCQGSAPVCEDGSSPGCSNGSWDSCPSYTGDRARRVVVINPRPGARATVLPARPQPKKSGETQKRNRE